MAQVISKNFVFKFPTCTTNQEYELEVPVEIPFYGDVTELTERIISVFDIPIYVKSGKIIIIYLLYLKNRL